MTSSVSSPLASSLSPSLNEFRSVGVSLDLGSKRRTEGPGQMSQWGKSEVRVPVFDEGGRDCVHSWLSRVEEGPETEPTTLPFSQTTFTETIPETRLVTDTKLFGIRR